MRFASLDGRRREGFLPPPMPRGGRSVARLIVPYAPGGTADVTARLSNRIAEELSRTWVTENRSGAQGAPCAAALARAAPDGLNLLYSSEVHLVLKLMQRGTPFDAVADFTPVARTVSIPYVLMGGAGNIRQSDAKALPAAVKKDPDRFTFAGSTLGSVRQLGAAALGQKMGAEFTIVACRGSGPAVNDLMSGGWPDVCAAWRRAAADSERTAQGLRRHRCPTSATAARGAHDGGTWLSRHSLRGLDRHLGPTRPVGR
jgi:hypothetical protein